MAKLETLDASSGVKATLEVLSRDGAAIIADLAMPGVVAGLNTELSPFIARTPVSSDDFGGRKTQRTGALVARCPASRGLVMHEFVVALAKAFLAPFASRIILHLTQSIRINPGQGRQVLHRDRLAWGGYLPPGIEPQFNTLWALTDFTAANGATRVVPGSQAWDAQRRAEPAEVCQAEMTAGSVLLHTGSVLHGGGENQAGAPRTGLNITYCLGWLRQEENQYLSCPPRIARTLVPELQELLGYTLGEYALGYYSDPESEAQGQGTLPPEVALGRWPDKDELTAEAVARRAVLPPAREQ